MPAVTPDDVFAMLTGRGTVAPSTGEPASPPKRARPYVATYDKCDQCGERMPGLISTKHPVTGKWGNWCCFCYSEHDDHATTRPEQLTFGDT